MLTQTHTSHVLNLSMQHQTVAECASGSGQCLAMSRLATRTRSVVARSVSAVELRPRGTANVLGEEYMKMRKSWWLKASATQPRTAQTDRQIYTHRHTKTHKDTHTHTPVRCVRPALPRRVAVHQHASQFRIRCLDLVRNAAAVTSLCEGSARRDDSLTGMTGRAPRPCRPRAMQQSSQSD